MVRICLDWVVLVWISLFWFGLVWIGLDWFGSVRFGLVLATVAGGPKIWQFCDLSHRHT